jgi:hypothetical protein
MATKTLQENMQCLSSLRSLPPKLVFVCGMELKIQYLHIQCLASFRLLHSKNGILFNSCFCLDRRETSKQRNHDDFVLLSKTLISKTRHRIAPYGGLWVLASSQNSCFKKSVKEGNMISASSISKVYNTPIMCAPSHPKCIFRKPMRIANTCLPTLPTSLFKIAIAVSECPCLE